jgi:hypothetical protein
MSKEKAVSATFLIKLSVVLKLGEGAAFSFIQEYILGLRHHELHDALFSVFVVHESSRPFVGKWSV